MCELGEAHFESESSIALIQTPYTSDGIARGLPGGIRVFTDEGEISLVLVVEPDLSYLEKARLRAACVYCSFTEHLELFLRYRSVCIIIRTFCLGSTEEVPRRPSSSLVP